MLGLFLNAALLAVTKSVDALVSTVDSIGTSISELFIASPVAVVHPHLPSPSVVKIIYLYGNWVPPYEQILSADPNLTVFAFEIQIPQLKWCFRCRDTEPGCRSCQKKRREFKGTNLSLHTAKLCAKVEIDNMMKNVKNFRDACKMFEETVFENLSYLHFLRMVQNSTFNFSDFDGFFRKYMNVYPVSQQLKDTGMQCEIYSDEDLMRFVQFPNSGKRIYPEFGNVSKRNEILALSMSMRILPLLVSTNHMVQSRKKLMFSRLLIAKRIIGRKLVSTLSKK